MAKRRKPKIEFRYYQMPPGSPILALLGNKWVQNYGAGIDYLHFHNYLEVGFCYYGEGSMILGEEEVRFSGREFTVIPKNFAHTTNSDPGNMSSWEYLFIDVDGLLQNIYSDNPRRMEKLSRRINAKALFMKEDECPEIARTILKIVDIMRNMEEFYLEEVTGVLAALLVEVARYNRLDDEEEPDQDNGKITMLISRSLDYVADNYMNDIKVEDLAKYTHISETHFRRVFSAYMKMSPLEYINTIRIQTACELLKTTDKPVSDIVHQCGFTTNSTFNRNFKQIMGMSPIEWRKRPENYEHQLLNFEIHSEEGW